MKKILTGLGICAALLLACMAGCSGTVTGFGRQDSHEDKQMAGESADSDEIVTLRWYMSISPVARDTQQVIEELNKYTREKIGVEIDYQITTDTDYEQKMPIYINAGEYFDICFASSWSTNYTQFVSKKAFLDITDLLPEYARATYELIPPLLWEGITIDGRIYGVPTYKELGWQGGLLVNEDIAKACGADLSKVKTMADFEEVLSSVKKWADENGQDVIGMSGLSHHQGFSLTNPYECMIGSQSLPGASKVEAYGNFTDQTDEVFNQYATPEYLEYCRMVRRWYENGYFPPDPVKYDTDYVNRDDDFQSGRLFAYLLPYAPGTAEMLEAKTGHGVVFIPFMKPLFETRNSMAGILALSARCEHPDKALEFINLLNTDRYVGTLIRHGIEGIHYTAAGEERVDKTMGGTLAPEDNGYDYTYGWQFGTPFNQKWDISYPEDIIGQFNQYNQSAIRAPHIGFSFDTASADAITAAVGSVVEEYGPALETGVVDPETSIPRFLDALEQSGVETLLDEIRLQLSQYKKQKGG